MRSEKIKKEIIDVNEGVMIYFTVDNQSYSINKAIVEVAQECHLLGC